MHIAEGVLSAPVLIAGAAVAAAGIAVGLKRLDESRLMTAGLVGAAFFIASLIHVPIGVSSAHPVSYTHLTLPTIATPCRSRWAP